MKSVKLASACLIALLVSACGENYPEYPVKVIRVVIAKEKDGTKIQATLDCDLVNSKDIIYKCHSDWGPIENVNGWFCMSPENKQQLEKMYLDGKEKYKLCKK